MALRNTWALNAAKKAVVKEKADVSSKTLTRLNNAELFGEGDWSLDILSGVKKFIEFEAARFREKEKCGFELNATERDI